MDAEANAMRLCLLRGLYGDAAAAPVGVEIDALITSYTRSIGARALAEPLSERDVLLITYGDTLTDDNGAPLEALQRFYREFLSDVFTLVHVLPFHPYSSDDGFSVIDYHAVRDDLGNWQNIESLAAECGLMTDAVINHMSSESEWFSRFLSGDPQFAGFFAEGDPSEDLSTVTRPRTSPLLTPYEDDDGNERFVWTTFSADQVDLNYRSPKVLLSVLEVLFHLVARGARLLRLDAVTFLWKEPGTSCANLPETHALIKLMRSAISELRPDVVVITETNVPHSQNVAYFGDGTDEAHMVYNFALPPLIAHSLITGDGKHLSRWASELSVPGNGVCFLNFTASHDGVGVRSVEEILPDEEVQRLVRAATSRGGLVSSRTMSDGEERVYELNCTYLDLISGADDDDEIAIARFVASQAIVLAMPGVPAIYIQSLLGTRNDAELARHTGRARSINRSQHAVADITDRLRLAGRGNFEASVFYALQSLIRVRREHAAFSPYAPFEVIDLGRRVFAMTRGEPGRDDSVTCIVNLTGELVEIDVSSAMAGSDILSSKKIGQGKRQLTPYAVHWIMSSAASRN